MQENTRILLRVLDKVERLQKLYKQRIRQLETTKAELHTKYLAYQAKEAEDTNDLPWA